MHRPCVADLSTVADPGDGAGGERGLGAVSPAEMHGAASFRWGIRISALCTALWSYESETTHAKSSKPPRTGKSWEVFDTSPDLGGQNAPPPKKKTFEMDDTIGIRDSFLSLDSFSLTFKNILGPLTAGGGGSPPWIRHCLSTANRARTGHCAGVRAYATSRITIPCSRDVSSHGEAPRSKARPADVTFAKRALSRTGCLSAKLTRRYRLFTIVHVRNGERGRLAKFYTQIA